MATAGIIEGSTTWRRVVDPVSAAKKTPTGLTLFFKRPDRFDAPKQVSRTDFLTDDIRTVADKFVADVKTIIESDTLADGYLGEPSDVTTALVSYLYNRLAGMLEADDALVHLTQARASNHGVEGAEELLARMETAVKDTVRVSVTDVVDEMEHLANQVRLLDLQIGMPQIVADREKNRIGSLNEVAGRISAICDLPLAR